MTIREILEGAVAVQRELEETPAGSPELAATVARITELRSELERTTSALGPLIPDVSFPRPSEERTAAALERTLVSLMKAARSKQEVASGD